MSAWAWIGLGVADALQAGRVRIGIGGSYATDDNFERWM